MAPNLAGPRRNVAKLMVDTCIIRRYSTRKAGKTLNRETLKVSTDATVAKRIYVGQCRVTTSTRLQSTPSSRAEASTGLDAEVGEYDIQIPFDAPLIRPGDVVEIKTSADPMFVGKKLTVQNVHKATFLVWRSFAVSDVETSRG